MSRLTRIIADLAKSKWSMDGFSCSSEILSVRGDITFKLNITYRAGETYGLSIFGLIIKVTPSK